MITVSEKTKIKESTSSDRCYQCMQDVENLMASEICSLRRERKKIILNPIHEIFLMEYIKPQFQNECGNLSHNLEKCSL